MVDDPYKYFRVEARELLEALSRDALEIEKGSDAKETIPRLLRAAHTLKGAARVVRQPEIADAAHAIEDRLASHRDRQGAVPQSLAQELLKLVDAISMRVGQLAPPSELPHADLPALEERFQTVRVETVEMDRLLAGVMEAAGQVSQLRDELESVDHARTLNSDLRSRLGGSPLQSIADELQDELNRHSRGLAASIDDANRELDQVRETADLMRLLPASVTFAALERAARDAAQLLNKRIAFHTSGGETKLDANVLAALQGALIHVVRNAVAHGIEIERERLAKGKAPVGRIDLRVERTGNRIHVSCHDDGRGIDVEAVRVAAARRKVLPIAELEGLKPQELASLLLSGSGLSTSASPTEVSGRGVGLDVVRETVARLQGEVEFRTETNRGTTFELHIPFSLSSIPALVVEADGITCCLPVDSVDKTLRVARTDIAWSVKGATIRQAGGDIPFVPLSMALGRPQPKGCDRNWSAVVVQSGGTRMAMGVDRMLGTTPILLKPIPPWVKGNPVVAAATLNVSGEPWLVLDPARLVTRTAATWSDVKSAEPRPAPVLVVDDSLTTRMLEQSILEASGYEVELATSGEEALRKARERRYSLMIVDVEMPGMNGFEVVAQTQSDPALCDLPSILVTSRNAPEDVRRGKEVGARAYLVKSEFDQKKLLSIIRSVIG